MIEAGLSPNLYTFTSSILGHTRKHDKDAASLVLKEMVDHTCGGRYEDLIFGFCEIGNMEIANKLLDQMLKEEETPSDYLFIVDAVLTEV
ncbi:unnamed protein product [Microthlaspi erraticum]|uniref:Pentatricopeptide repeat-containing protein n=1 Tax=Microthlaspi erraticum TaxID=1685480 RepID=A0A6D2I4H1_9BRAS|nr:unnamed protein product [Microthlaspi erraticum]